MMYDEIFKCMCLAKEKSDLSYAIKGNEKGLKRKSEQSEASMAMLLKEIGELEEKRKKLSK